jgi:hypothetical protein
MSLNQGNKQAGISLSGALGGSFRGLKPMGIGASRLSNKPPEEPQLGDKTNNPFLKKKQLSASPIGGNLNKTATQFDVTPYTLSSYDNLGGLRAQAYTDQNYTSQRTEIIKAASFKLLSALTSAALPKVMEAFPAAADYSKNLVNSYKQYSASKPFAESGFGKLLSSFGENLAAEGKGRLASSLANGVSSFLTPTPSPTPSPLILNNAQAGEANKNLRDSISNSTSRAQAQDAVRNLPTVAPTPPPRTFQTAEQAAVSNKNLSETLSRISNTAAAQSGSDDINKKYEEFLAAGGKATTPQNSVPVGASLASNVPALPVPPPPDVKPVIKYKTNEEAINASRISDAKARAAKSGLSASDAGRSDLAQAIVNHSHKYRTGDLTDLPPEIRSAFEGLPKEHKDAILKRMVGNATHIASLDSGAAYEPVFGSKGVDKGVLYAGGVGNTLTNIAKTLGSLVPGIDPEVPIPNLPPPTSNLTPFDGNKVIQGVDSSRAVIDSDTRIQDASKAIKELDTRILRSTDPVSKNEDKQKLKALVGLRDKYQKELANNSKVGDEDKLPLFDPSKGTLEKGTETFFDALALTPVGRAIALGQGVLGFGAHSADIPNADLIAGLGGLASPRSLRSIPDLLKNIKEGPAAVLRALKNFNATKAIKAAPMAAARTALSTPGLIAANEGPEILKAITRKNVDATNPDAYFPPADKPSKGVAPPQKGVAPLQKGEAPPQKGEAPPQKGVAQPQKGVAPSKAKEIVKEIKEKITPAGLSSLQKALIAGGMTIPAVLALTQVLKGSQESEEDDDEA